MPLPHIAFLYLSLFPLQAGRPASGEPRAVIREAERAMEGDTVAAVRSRWESVSQQNPGDRVAQLGMATLARLGYDYPTADSLYRRIMAGPRDLYSVYARIGLPHGDRIHRALDSARAGFSSAVQMAQALGDRAGQVEALIGLAVAASRLEPIDSALRILHRAEPLLPAGDAELESRLRCTRVPILLGAGKPGAKQDADRGLALARGSGQDRLLGHCWQALGSYLFINVDDPAVSGPPFDSAEAHFRRARDLAGVAEAMVWSGYDHFSFFDNSLAMADFTAGIEAARQSGNRSAEAWAHRLRGSVEWRTGAFPTASRDLSVASQMARQLGDRLELLQVARMQGNVAFGQGRIAEAEAVFREALPVGEQMGDAVTITTVKTGLAWVSASHGDWDSAWRQFQEILAFMNQHGLQGLIPGMRYGGGVIALRRGNLDSAEAAFRWYLRSSSQSEYVGRCQSRSRLAEIQARRGNLDSAIAELTRASDHLDSLRASLRDDQLRALAFRPAVGSTKSPTMASPL